MTTTKRRRERQELNPDLGLLAIQLAAAMQREFFSRLAAEDFEGLESRHAAVLAYLDEDGVRATDLARLSGSHKQAVGRLIDELEALGYLERRPDPGDRRAKLVVPTARGLAMLQRGDAIIAEIEARNASAIGGRSYAEFRDALRGVVSRGRETVPA